MDNERHNRIRAMLLRIGIATCYAALSVGCFRLVWSGGASGFAEERVVGRWESGQLATRFRFGSAGEVRTTFPFSLLLWAAVISAAAALSYVITALNTLAVHPWDLGDPTPSVFDRRTREERASARERERFRPATILMTAGMWLLIVTILALFMALIFTFGVH